ncbi:MAG: phosphoribosylaminoimidazolesuccinocarboxamide synthase [Vampirovibrionales bacterium]|jgi:phosphoribosylaminoimidazole-succinocarboxamide synthase|nr:phosphoribosylaminoimidazolesuccinocarboxamide synthase [Vampirovibrionales bacterium]
MKTPHAQEGKTKILTPQANGTLQVHFKSDATAFNGVKKAHIEGKGELNARISALLFRYLESQGIRTCFVDNATSPDTLLYKPLSMLPVEIIVRNVAYGGFCKRFPFVEAGTVFKQPLVEFCLKDDALGDPPLPDDALVVLDYVPAPYSVADLKTLALAVNTVFVTLFGERSITCADFKLEVGIDAEGALLLGDELSPDNFRLRDTETGTILDKDVFRLDCGDLKSVYSEVLRRLEAV